MTSTELLELIKDLFLRPGYNRMMAACNWQCKLGKCIGHGGFGRVYALKGTHDGSTGMENGKLRHEVVKIIDLRRCTQEFEITSCEREIEVMRQLNGCGYTAKLNSYHIVTAKDLSPEDDSEEPVIIFLNMPRYRTFAKDTTLPETKVIRMGVDICEALKILVRLRELHRDVKPSNIFYDSESSHYILGDFGITKTAAESNNTRMVRNAFYPPEFYDQRLTAEVWTRLNADLYSLAASMASFLGCPQKPVSDPNTSYHLLDFEYFKQNKKACPPLMEILEKALQPYDRRYQTPDEMQADLKILLDYVNRHGGNLPTGMTLDALRNLDSSNDGPAYYAPPPPREDHAELARNAAERGDFRLAHEHSLAGHEHGDLRCTSLLAYSTFHLIRQGALTPDCRPIIEQKLHTAIQSLETEAMRAADNRRRAELLSRAAPMKYLLAVSRYETGDIDTFLQLAISAANCGSPMASYVCGRGMYTGDAPFSQDSQRGWDLLLYAAGAGYGAAISFVRQVRQNDPFVDIPWEIRTVLSTAGATYPEHRLGDILREL